MLNYNIMLMACQYGSIKILEYLYTNVVGKSSDPRQTKKDLLYSKKPTLGGIQAEHLAFFLGNLDVLKILKEKFSSKFDTRTNYGLTPLHCAA